jgi:hypothetical protein
MKWLIRRRRETVVIFSSWNVWFVHVIRVGHPKPSQVLKTVNFGLFARNIIISQNFTVEFGVALSVKIEKNRWRAKLTLKLVGIQIERLC